MTEDLERRLSQNPITPDSRITTIVSGGMDSVTLLYLAVSKTIPDKVSVLSFDYGQKHRKELTQAQRICEELGVRHNIVNLQSATDLLKSSLTDKTEAVPYGHYAEDNMKATVVPNRNAIMLSIAYGAAISSESDHLLYGAHTGDHFIYPDCRPEFVQALDRAFQIGNEGFGHVNILAPFSTISKSEIVTLGLELKVPYEKTYTCYQGGEKHCGQCGTCTERIISFNDNGIQDPVEYEKGWDWSLNNALTLEAKFKVNG